MNIEREFTHGEMKTLNGIPRPEEIGPQRSGEELRAVLLHLFAELLRLGTRSIGEIFARGCIENAAAGVNESERTILVAAESHG